MGDWRGSFIIRRRSTEMPELLNHHADQRPSITAAKRGRDSPAPIDNAC
jgi:hypothetical protein